MPALLTFFLRPFAVRRSLAFGSLLRALGRPSLGLFACLGSLLRALGRASLGGLTRLRSLLLHGLRLASGLLGIAIGRLLLSLTLRRFHLLLLLLHALRRCAVLFARSRALFTLLALRRLSRFGLRALGLLGCPFFGSHRFSFAALRLCRLRSTRLV